MARIIRDKVREILKDFKGEVISTEYIADELGLPVEAVQSCIRNMMRDKVAEIEVVTRGREWRYLGDSPVGNAKQEFPFTAKIQVLTTAHGKFVFNMDGVIYVAKPLEF